jgi:Tol biopolymer transport system component
VRGVDLTRSAAQPTASALAPRATVRPRGRRYILAAAAVAAAVVAAVSYGLYTRPATSPPSKPPLSTRLRFSRFTVSGNVEKAAVSRDGKYVVYITSDAAGHAMWLRQVTASSAVQILPPAPTGYRKLAFSADGSAIRYVPDVQTWSPGKGSWSVFQIPLLGGPPQEIARNIEYAVDIGTGDRVAFSRSADAEGDKPRYAIFVTERDGREHQIGMVTGRGVEELALSPDGAHVVALTYAIPPEHGALKLVEIPADGSGERPIGAEAWQSIAGLAWTPDGGSLLLSAAHRESEPNQLWRVAYPSGDAEQLTNDLNGFDGLSFATDLGTLCTVQVTGITGLRVADLDDPSRGRVVTHGTDDGFLGVAWTRDGRLVYTSGAPPESDLWVCAADGSQQRQLTLAPSVDIQPAVSLDGTMVYYASNSTGTFHVWSVPLDGGQPRQLTDGVGELWPQRSSDGAWVVYESAAPKSPPTVWRIPTGTGTPEAILEAPSERPSASPAGDLVAYRMGRPATPMSGICVCGLDGKGGRRIVAISTTAMLFVQAINLGITQPAFRFAPDGRALLFTEPTEKGVRLMRQAIDGGPARKVADFDEAFAFFDLSPDGHQIVYPSQTYTADVVLATGLAPAPGT